MRAFRFRAWDGKKMYYDIQNAYDGHEGLPEDSFGLFLGEANFCRVPTAEYEVMQFADLHDKNGKEIYEGDLIKWLGWEVREGRQIRPERKYVLGGTEGWITDLYHTRNLVESNGTVEVIGNIYENPELLEGK